MVNPGFRWFPGVFWPLSDPRYDPSVILKGSDRGFLRETGMTVNVFSMHSLRSGPVLMWDARDNKKRANVLIML